ncbi:MAG: response regulator [Elusimicrobia bacterium]|nr:response regulator [Elusimicrobiota bacterium]
MSAETAIPQGRRLVVVDDNLAIRAMIVEAAQGLGQVVVAVDDGTKALEKIRAHRPDAVFLDLNLGKLDGADIYRALRSDPSLMSLPVIICTVSRVDTANRKLSDPAVPGDPALFYLYKPFTVSGMYVTLATAFGCDLRNLPPLHGRQ